jgi:cytoskeletal protein CcmA (bactofilin family)
MFKSRSDAEIKSPAPAVNGAGAASIPRPRMPTSETVSTLGPGMLVKGSIVCEGPMQVYGRMFGEIHAVKLTIGEGAQVEGQILAEETIIAGNFKGTIHAKNVKLERTAVVDGEIFKNTLVIDQDAQFEGMTRRLEKSIELPSIAQVVGDAMPIAPTVTEREAV